MKGQIQLQTITYVIFAILFVLVGTFSIELYLSNVKVDKTYEFANMDASVIGKRAIGSQECFSIPQEIIFPAKKDNPEYSIFYVDEGLVERNLLTTERMDSCFKGHSKEELKVTFFDISEEPEEIISWGKECTDNKFEFIIRLNGATITPGLVEVCIQ
tara:strand:+ start:3639 stop:4112 length:474 start_codon:yes stop_codon:yes gene_type:complete